MDALTSLLFSIASSNGECVNLSIQADYWRRDRECWVWKHVHTLPDWLDFDWSKVTMFSRVKPSGDLPLDQSFKITITCQMSFGKYGVILNHNDIVELDSDFYYNPNALEQIFAKPPRNFHLFRSHNLLELDFGTQFYNARVLLNKVQPPSVVATTLQQLSNLPPPTYDESIKFE
jgi:hypothetical protein